MDSGLRSHLLLALLLVSCKASAQGVTVEAVVGESVILPCSAGRYKEDVHWRDKDSRTVYDVISGKVDVYDQHAAYKSRVDAFPSEFAKGNYSIRLREVKPTDTGRYRCHIPYSDPRYVELKVTSDHRRKTEERRDSEEKADPRSGCATGRAGGTSLFLLVCLLLCGFAV